MQQRNLLLFLSIIKNIIQTYTEKKNKYDVNRQAYGDRVNAQASISTFA